MTEIKEGKKVENVTRIRTKKFRYCWEFKSWVFILSGKNLELFLELFFIELISELKQLWRILFVHSAILHITLKYFVTYANEWNQLIQIVKPLFFWLSSEMYLSSTGSSLPTFVCHSLFIVIYNWAIFLPVILAFLVKLF